MGKKRGDNRTYFLSIDAFHDATAGRRTLAPPKQGTPDHYDPELPEILDAADRAPPVHTARSAAELMGWLRRDRGGEK